MSVKSLIYDERNFVEKKIKQHNNETTTTKKSFSFMPNIPSYMRRFCVEGNFQD